MNKEKTRGGPLPRSWSEPNLSKRHSGKAKGFRAQKAETKVFKVLFVKPDTKHKLKLYNYLMEIFRNFETLQQERDLLQLQIQKLTLDCSKLQQTITSIHAGCEDSIFKVRRQSLDE